MVYTEKELEIAIEEVLDIIEDKFGEDVVEYACRKEVPSILWDAVYGAGLVEGDE